MQNRAASFFYVMCLVVAVGCGGDDGSNPGDGDGGPDDAGPAGSFSVTWGPVSVGPGIEDTQCVTKRLGNPDQLRVHQLRNVLGATSHHFIVYRVSDTVEQPDPYPCQPFSDTLDPTKGAPLMITQKAEETLTLPDGVAFTLEPNQMVRLEMHYVNATDQQQDDVQATATFIPIAESDFENEADFLFVGNPDVDVPAGQATTLGPTYFPMAVAGIDGANFFAITGHEHQWGTNVQVATSTGPAGADTMVYDVANFNWDEPETVFHDPPFQVPSGGGLRFTCEWMNTSTTGASFGDGANDEMCFFWTYYYPSQGAKVCIHTDQAGGADLCCPGSNLCGLIQDQF